MPVCELLNLFKCKVASTVLSVKRRWLPMWSPARSAGPLPALPFQMSVKLYLLCKARCAGTHIQLTNPHVYTRARKIETQKHVPPVCEKYGAPSRFCQGLARADHVGLMRRQDSGEFVAAGECPLRSLGKVGLHSIAASVRP